jgi:hypothetical protein
VTLLQQFTPTAEEVKAIKRLGECRASFTHNNTLLLQTQLLMFSSTA